MTEQEQKQQEQEEKAKAKERLEACAYALRRFQRIGGDRLLPHHREEFHRSAISDELIDAANIFSIPTPTTATSAAALGALIGRSTYPPEWGAAWVAPHYNAAGEPYYCLLKHDVPRCTRKEPDKLFQYECVLGVGLQCYFPIDSRKLILGGAEIILITEGVKKALAAYGADFRAVIGLNGVYGWKGDRKKKSYKLIGDMWETDWRGKYVVICFDSDSIEIKQVEQAEERLDEAIVRRCRRQIYDNEGGIPAKVAIVRLPPKESGEKNGLDDYIYDHGKEAFIDLVQAAVDAAVAKQPRLSTLDEDKVAAQFLKDSKKDGCSAITAKGEDIELHNGRFFEPLTPRHFSIIVHRHTRKHYSHASHGLEHVVNAIRARCLDEELQLNRWRNDAPPGWEDTNYVIPFRNGLYSLMADKLIPHTPRLYTRGCLGVDFNHKSKYPKLFDGHLAHRCVFDGDKDQIKLLLQYGACIATIGAAPHNFYMLLGKRRSGKGLILHSFEHLVGSLGAKPLTPKALGSDSFALETVYDRQLVTISDARTPKKNVAGFCIEFVLENLLMMTGGDLMSYNRKYRAAVAGRWQPRIMVASNSNLGIPDSSGALAERALYGETRGTIPEAERDNTLEPRIIASELEGLAYHLLIPALGEYAPEWKFHTIPRDKNDVSPQDELRATNDSWIRTAMLKEYEFPDDPDEANKARVTTNDIVECLENYQREHNFDKTSRDWLMRRFKEEFGEQVHRKTDIGDGRGRGYSGLKRREKVEK